MKLNISPKNLKIISIKDDGLNLLIIPSKAANDAETRYMLLSYLGGCVMFLLFGGIAGALEYKLVTHRPQDALIPPVMLLVLLHVIAINDAWNAWKRHQAATDIAVNKSTLLIASRLTAEGRRVSDIRTYKKWKRGWHYYQTKLVFGLTDGGELDIMESPLIAISQAELNKITDATRYLPDVNTLSPGDWRLCDDSTIGMTELSKQLIDARASISATLDIPQRLQTGT